VYVGRREVTPLKELKKEKKMHCLNSTTNILEPSFLTTVVKTRG